MIIADIYDGFFSKIGNNCLPSLELLKKRIRECRISCRRVKNTDDVPEGIKNIQNYIRILLV